MAKDTTSSHSSAFDGLLEKSRQEWTTLASGVGVVGGRSSPAASGPAASAPPSRPVAPAARPVAPAAPQAAGAASGSGSVLRPSGEYVSAARVWSPSKSEAAAYLFIRFGSEWQIEVAERRREGDEIVVLVKLTVAGKNLVKSQFGRGKIPSASEGNAIRGSAGGVAFSLGAESEAPTQPPEDRGYRRAIENGLAKCVELL